jgi:hypothetical protein
MFLSGRHPSAVSLEGQMMEDETHGAARNYEELAKFRQYADTNWSGSRKMAAAVLAPHVGVNVTRSDLEGWDKVSGLAEKGQISIDAAREKADADAKTAAGDIFGKAPEPRSAAPEVAAPASANANPDNMGDLEAEIDILDSVDSKDEWSSSDDEWPSDADE